MGTCGCNMASFSLHDGTRSSTRTHLVRRLGNLPITVASFLFSKVIKTIPALLTEGGSGVLKRLEPWWEPPSSVAKQEMRHIQKPDCIFLHNLF